MSLSKKTLSIFAVLSISIFAAFAGGFTASYFHLSSDQQIAHASPTTAVELYAIIKDLPLDQQIARLQAWLNNANDITQTAQGLLTRLQGGTGSTQSIITMPSTGLPAATAVLAQNYPGEFNTTAMISCAQSLQTDPTNSLCNISKASLYLTAHDYLLFYETCGRNPNNVYYMPYANGITDHGRQGEFLCLNGQGGMTYKGTIRNVDKSKPSTNMYATAADLTCDNITNAVIGNAGTKLLYYVDGTVAPPTCTPPPPNSGFGGSCPVISDTTPRIRYKINAAAIAKMDKKLCNYFRMRSSINYFSFATDSSASYDQSWTNDNFCEQAVGTCTTPPTTVENILKLATPDMCSNDSAVSAGALKCITSEFNDSYNKSWDCVHSLSRQLQEMCGFTSVQASDKICNGGGAGKGYCGITQSGPSASPSYSKTEYGKFGDNYWVDNSFIGETGDFNIANAETCVQKLGNIFGNPPVNTTKCSDSNTQYKAIMDYTPRNIAKCKRENLWYYTYKSDTTKGEFVCAGNGYMTKGNQVIMIKDFIPRNTDGNNGSTTTSGNNESTTVDRPGIYPNIAVSSCRVLPESEYKNLGATNEHTQRTLVNNIDPKIEFCVDKNTKSSPHVYIPYWNHACMFQDCIEWVNLQTIKRNNYFGAVNCWDLARLENPKLNANNQNKDIITEVKRAKQIGAPRDFWYCVKEDNTSPHLYVPTENRTCLVSGDNNCYKGIPN